MTRTVTVTAQAERQLATLPDEIGDLALAFIADVLPEARRSRATKKGKTPMGTLYSFKKKHLRVLAAVDGPDITVIGFGIRQQT